MAVWRSFRSLIRRRRLERELDAELRFHLERQIDENLRRGMSSSEARRAARVVFGRTDTVRDDCRQACGLRQLDMLHQDIRHGIRRLWRNPAFSATTILTLALGIGATTVVFSVVDSILINPVPFRDPDKLVEIWRWSERGGGPQQPAAMLPRWREQTHIFEQVEAHWEGSYALTGAEDPVAVYGSQISVGLLPFLGVRPELGRSFAADESEARIAIISHRLWMRWFGGDPDVIGRSLRLDDDLFTVVGVMPDWFRFPVGGVELWIPFDPSHPNPQAPRASLTPVARLRPGLSLEEADKQVAVLALRLDETLSSFPAGTTARLQPLSRYGPNSLVAQAYFSARPRTALFLIFGAAGLVLLTSCVNSANLFLSRALSRSHDVAVRAAVGGTRSRLVRQTLTEAVLLAAVAGSVGLLLAGWTLSGLTTVIPADLADDSLNPLDLDRRGAAWAVIASILAGLIAALIPAVRSVPGDLITPLQDRATARAHGSMALRGVLITVESAFALVLLIGAGLMVRTLWTLLHVDTGWSRDDVVVMEPLFRGGRYQNPVARFDFITQLTDALRATPRVRSVALADSVPFKLTMIAFGTLRSEKSTVPDAQWAFHRISTDYFRALGIPVQRGRAFAPQDFGQDHVVVSQDLAELLWPGADPIGQRLYSNEDRSAWSTVVGVVRDVRSMPFDRPQDPFELYSPLTVASENTPANRNRYRYLIVRIDDREALTSTLKHSVWKLDPELPVSILPMRELYRDSTADPEFQTTLLTAFALVALLLAGGGFYAAVAYDASRRTQEMGIRVALGATRSDVIRHVMGRCLLLASFGVVVGLAGAYALTRLMDSMLYEIQPTDPPTFAAAALFLLLTAALAGYLPARRATRVNPVEALRAE